MQEQDFKPGDKVFFIAGTEIRSGEIEEIKVYRTKDEERYSFDVKTERTLYLGVEKVFDSRTELLRVFRVGESEAIELLRELCQLKEYKDGPRGKDSYYLQRQPELWKAAKELLERLEK